MSIHYKKFLLLLEKWPVDKTKPGRDLGEYLRNQLKTTLGDANIISVKDDKIDKQFVALERLSNDTYLKKYQRTYTSSATGLSGEQCKQVLSSEFLDYLSEEGKTK